MLQIILADDTQDQIWDKLCEESPDAWIWHTSQWRKYTRIFKQEILIKDLSFLVIENSTPLAGCLLHIERTETGHAQFMFAKEPLHAPFFSPGLNPDKKKQVMDLIIETIEAHAKTYNAVSIEFARSALLDVLPVNPWARYGFHDSSIQTAIIDLTLPESELFSRCSKGHKSCIKQSKRLFTMNLWDSSNISREDFTRYQELHRLDVGRVTRPPETFEIMYNLIKSGNGFLLETIHSGKTVGFVLVFIYKKRAFYTSSCRHPEFYELPIHHFLIWEAIVNLSKRGMLFFEIGLQFFGHEFFRNPSSKLTQLSLFKRGFGCELRTIACAERFWSKEYAKEEWNKRLSHWLEGLHA